MRVLSGYSAFLRIRYVLDGYARQLLAAVIHIPLLAEICYYDA